MKAFLSLTFLALASCGSADKPANQSTVQTPAAPVDPHRDRIVSLHRYYHESDSSQLVRVTRLRAEQYPGLAKEQETVAAALAQAKSSLDQLDQIDLSKPVNEPEFNRLADKTDNALGQAKVAGLMAIEASSLHKASRPK